MRIIGIFILLLANYHGIAQAFVYVDSITITGNRKTKDNIILRELSFKVGDSIEMLTLTDVLTQSQQMVMNTSLFNKAEFTVTPQPDAPQHIRVTIAVDEAWYLYPVPLFELADRNFNVWWVEQDRSLERVNFGGDFTHLNITGRADRLKLGAKYGYTQSYFLGYSLPYINGDQTIGMSAELSYARNREVNYATNGNKQLFYQNNDKFLYSRFRAQVGLRYRPGLRTVHQFYLSYHQNTISDSISDQLNPYFFQYGENLQRYLAFAYQFTFDSRDVRPYPMSGNFLSARLERDGLGFFNDRNSLTLLAYFDHYQPITPRLSAAVKLGGKASLIRSRQPYSNNRAFGFGKNSLHGYEYYVVDGMDMGFLKTNLRFKLFEKSVNFKQYMPLKQLRVMPVKVFAGLNNDIGFVHESYCEYENPLANRLLWGGGIGLDFIFFYDKVVRLEYNFNHLMERGIFF